MMVSDASVTDGELQLITLEDVPNSVVSEMLLGQFSITGDRVSSVKYDKINNT